MSTRTFTKEEKHHIHMKAMMGWPLTQDEKEYLHELCEAVMRMKEDREYLYEILDEIDVEAFEQLAEPLYSR